MKISVTYRFIASLLSLSIFIGVSLPSGLHAKDLEECEAMETMHSDHHMPITMMAGHDDCPMEHQHKNAQSNPATSNIGMHDYGFACACSIDEAPVKTEAPVYQKAKAKILLLVQVIAEDHTNQTESDNHAILISDSYSPPPIFLANETFLI